MGETRAGTYLRWNSKRTAEAMLTGALRGFRKGRGLWLAIGSASKRGGRTQRTQEFPVLPGG
jgi:hypothetical protein